MQERLVFVIGPPRSGSTMLQRMLGSHSAIYTHPEPHIITPLAHLGYFENIDKAPYDHINAAEAIREYVEELPGREDDYLDA
ncbi:MAG: sulfotransferase [Deltaproteobacteria bacterium]|nr:sulfotransferase [Deltaproteobacteria bacterium]